ncbi:FmdB family zinc ribbon protein [Rhodospira trueperi]|nr:zinc ribbon domain-containing protein [Rhodospira trueperi]
MGHSAVPVAVFPRQHEVSMPIFSYQCALCGETFETLVSGGDAEAPVCPACGASEVERLLSAPAIGGRVKAATRRARSSAAREGHFSHYAKSELKGKL